MARPASQHPTDGELEILRVLWDRGPSSLGDVCAALRAEREVATTTVATMLRVMHGKKLVRRKQVGRGLQWTAAVSHTAAARSMVGKLIDGVFDGSAQRLVAHLVEGGELSADELVELRTLINVNSNKDSRKAKDAQNLIFHAITWRASRLGVRHSTFSEITGMNTFLWFDSIEWWQLAGWTMLHFLWLGVAVGIVAAVARLVLRRAAPVVRYAVAVGYFALLAAALSARRSGSRPIGP